MFNAILLICALSVPREDCDLSTALRWMPAGPQESPMACMMMGQHFGAMAVARGELKIEENEYPKVICTSGPAPRNA